MSAESFSELDPWMGSALTTSVLVLMWPLNVVVFRVGCEVGADLAVAAEPPVVPGEHLCEREGRVPHDFPW